MEDSRTLAIYALKRKIDFCLLPKKTMPLMSTVINNIPGLLVADKQKNNKKTKWPVEIRKNALLEKEITNWERQTDTKGVVNSPLLLYRFPLF